MKYGAGFSSVLDAYRAGEDLARQLAHVAPEVVVLFCSQHYHEKAADLAAGIQEVLGEDVLCCGCTGDGVYWSGGAATLGVAALAISSQGQATWTATLARGLGAESAATARRAAARVQQQLEAPPDFSIVLADGCRADGAGIVEGLRQVLHGSCFGGLAADDRRFVRTAVFLNRQVVQDAVLLLGARGQIPVGVSAASGWSPIGERGTVTAASSARVHRIDDRSASSFIRDQIGRNVEVTDLGVVPFAEYPAEAQGRFVLRSPSAVDERTGDVALFGSIAAGTQVRVCRASTDDILRGVDSALGDAASPGFHTKAAILISCAGRRWRLAEGGQEEVERAKRVLGNAPFIGLPSFGEIGPFRNPDGGYSPLLFHNVTFVACLLGG